MTDRSCSSQIAPPHFVSSSPSKSSSESPATSEDAPSETEPDKPCKPPALGAFVKTSLEEPSKASAPNRRDKANTKHVHTVKKPKQKRRGKIITELRKKSTLVNTALRSEVSSLLVRSALGSFNLAPSSTSAKIGSKEMAGSLTWHLINLTGPDSGMSSRASPLQDLRVAYENLAHIAMQNSSGGSKFDEVMFSVLAAIGARRSNHSAIVGLDGCRLADDAPLNLVVKLQIGMRREQACRRLVDIAIERLQSSGLMEDSSPEAYDALTMFRMMMHGTSHDHDFAGQVIDAMKTRVTRSMAQGDVVSHPHLRTQLIIFDTLNAISSGSSLRIKDDELLFYDWKYTDTQSGRRYEPVVEQKSQFQRIEPQFLSNTLSETRLRSAGDTSSVASDPMTSAKQFSQCLHLLAVGIYREIAYLKVKDPGLQLPTSVITPFFERLVVEFRKSVQWILETNVSRTVVLPHIMSTAHVVVSALVHEVQRRCQGRYDEKTQDLINKVQCSYLTWLHQLVAFMHELPQEAATLQTRALMISRFDTLPGWVEVAVNGATQNALGIGPLSEAGFTLEDLEIVHDSIKRTSVFYGSIGKREEELAAALSSMELNRKTSDDVLGANKALEETEFSIDAGSMVEDVSKSLMR